jgi:hypothetical protein
MSPVALLATDKQSPDWTRADLPELVCPLCEYNLRGLTEPRCPECGFAFQWAELIQGQRDKHPYLFEHYPKLNIWSFFKTYTSDWAAQHFWEELNPAQRVRPGRLILFWMISIFPLVGTFLWTFGLSIWLHSGRYAAVFGNFQNIQSVARYICFAASNSFQYRPFNIDILMVLIWPILTLLCLLVFVQSMHRAKIRKRHLLRVVIYGCDFSLMMTAILIMESDARWDSGWPMVIALICAAISQYRLYFAYSRYLRFDHPFLTVLSSQIMVFMVALIVYFQLYTPW